RAVPLGGAERRGRARHVDAERERGDAGAEPKPGIRRPGQGADVPGAAARMIRWRAERVNYALVVASCFSPLTVLAVYFVRVVHMSPLQLVLTGTVMEAAIFLL